MVHLRILDHLSRYSLVVHMLLLVDDDDDDEDEDEDCMGSIQ